MNKKAMDLLHGFAGKNNCVSWGGYKGKAYAIGTKHPITIQLELMEFIAYIESRRKKYEN